MITSDLHTQVVITELADGLEISVDTDGLERLPLRMELCVPSQTTLENDHSAWRQWLESQWFCQMIM